MKARFFLVLPIVAATVAPGCVHKEPPNVVFLLIDACRPDHLSAYGYSRPTSPHIEAIARDGVRFERAHCQATWTGSSMASIFTGFYPSTHGVITNPTHTAGETYASSVLSEKATTLPAALRSSGYHTAAIVTNVFLRRDLGFAQGFDSYQELEHKTLAEDVNHTALAWLEKRPPGPFFLYLHYMDAHGPYSPPPPYDEMFKPEKPRLIPDGVEIQKGIRLGDCRDLSVYEARYDGGIRYCDDEIGSFVKKLDDLGLGKNTLLIVAADHGEEFFEHGGFGHGRTLYEELLRIPLVMRLPGRIPANQVVHTGVRAIDVFPTVLDLCNVAAPHAMHGRSLLGLMNETDSAEREIFAEIHIKGGGLICRKLDNVKEIFHVDLGEFAEHYELREDPGEKSNAIDRLSAAERSALQKKFADYQRERAIEAQTWSSTESKGLPPDAIERAKANGYFGDSPKPDSDQDDPKRKKPH